MVLLAKRFVIIFLCLFLLPVVLHGAIWWAQGWPRSWSHADWSSAGVLADPTERPEATVRVYAARTGRWKGIIAVHSWLVIKRAHADQYDRYDVVGWGRPVRRNNYAADARWYGNDPELVFAVDGKRAEAAIPALEEAANDVRLKDAATKALAKLRG